MASEKYTPRYENSDQSIMDAFSQGVGLVSEGVKRKQDADLRKFLQKEQQMADIEKLNEQAELAKQAEIEGSKRSIQTMEELLGKYPKAAISFDPSGRLSVNPEDDMSALIKQQQLGNQMDQALRLETGKLQEESQRIMGKQREKALALRQLEGYLENPTADNIGQMKASLARMKESGVLTDADIQRYMPTTIKSKAADLAAFFGKRDINPLMEGQADNVKKLLAQERKTIEDSIKAGRGEISRRAPYLAPTLTRTGKAPEVLESLGSGTENILPVAAPEQPAAPLGFPSQDAIQKELERRARAIKGK